MENFITNVITFGESLDYLDIWAYIILGIMVILVIIGIASKARTMGLSIAVTAFFGYLILVEMSIHYGSFSSSSFPYVVLMAGGVLALIYGFFASIAMRPKKAVVEEVYSDGNVDDMEVAELVEEEEVAEVESTEDMTYLYAHEMTEVDTLVAKVNYEVNVNTSATDIRVIASQLKTMRDDCDVINSPDDYAKINKAVLKLAQIVADKQERNKLI